jgi:hypothetical protein
MQDGKFDRSFDRAPSWNGEPGWATIPFDHHAQRRAGHLRAVCRRRAAHFFAHGDCGRAVKYWDLSFDTRFNNGAGWRRYSLGGAEVMPNAVMLDNQGRLVIAGTRRYNPDTDDWDFFVMRINDDVLFEDSFGD